MVTMAAVMMTYGLRLGEANLTPIVSFAFFSYRSLLKKTGIITIFLFILVGCTVKNQEPITKHEKERLTPPPATSQSSAEENSTEAYVSELPLEQFYQIYNSENVNLDQDILGPLAEEYLNAEVLKKSGLADHPRFKWGLRLFNRALIELIDQEKTFDTESGQVPRASHAYLQRYENILQQGCDSNTWKNCLFHRIFSQDINSSKITKEIAQTKTNVREYFAWLQLTSEFQNISYSGHNPDSELYQLILTRSKELLESYIKLEELENGELSLSIDHLTPIQRTEFKDYIDYITLALKVSLSRENLEGLQDSVSDFILWIGARGARSALDKNFIDALSTSIEQALVSDNIWENFSRDALRSFESNQTDSTQLPFSYFGTHRYLQAKNPKILTALDFNFFQPEVIAANRDKVLYLYILQGLFKQDPLNRLLVYWNASSQDPSAFIELMESYISILLLRNTTLSHQRIAEIFKRRQQSGLDRKEVIWDTIADANRDIEPVWIQFHQGFANIRSFFISYIQPFSDNDESTLFNQIKSAENFLDHINPNIKKLAVYPNIFMLAYYASRWSYSEERHIFWIKIKIDKDMIIANLLDGKIPPFFKFTSYEQDRDALDSVGVLQSLYYLIASDLLSLYEIEPHQWMNELFLPHLEKSTIPFQKVHSNYVNMENAQNSLYNQSLQLCQNLEQAWTEYQETGSSDFRFDIQNNLRDLRQNSVFLDYSRLNSNYSSPTNNLFDLLSLHNLNRYNRRYPGFEPLPEAKEIIRSDIDPKLRIVELLQTMFQQHLSPNELEKFKENLSIKFSDVAEMRNNAIELFSRFTKSINECLKLYNQLELHRRSDIYELEKEYVTDITLALQTGELAYGKLHLPLRELRSHYPDLPIDQSPRLNNLNEDLTLAQAVNEQVVNLLKLHEVFAINPELSSQYRSSCGFRLNEQSGRLSYLYGPRDRLLRMSRYLVNGRYGDRSIKFKPDQVEFNYGDSYRFFALVFDISGDTSKPVCDQSISSQTSYSQRDAHNHPAFHSLMDFFFNTRIFSVQALKNGILQIFRNLVSDYKLQYLDALKTSQRVNCDSVCMGQLRSQMESQATTILETALYYSNLFNHSIQERLNQMTLDHHGLSYYRLGQDGSDMELTFFVHNGLRYLIGLGDAIYAAVTSSHLGREAFFPIDPQGLTDLWKNHANGDGEADGGVGGAQTVTLTVPRVKTFAKAEEHFRSLLDGQDTLTFPIPDHHYKFIESHFTAPVHLELLLTESFENAANLIDQTYDLPPGNWGQTLNSSDRVWMLSTDIKDSVHEIRAKFHSDTQFVFELPEE